MKLASGLAALVLLATLGTPARAAVVPAPEPVPPAQVTPADAPASPPTAMPAVATGPSEAMARLHTDATSLRLLMQATQALMVVYAQGQPGPDEMAALHAQFQVIRQRMQQWQRDAQAFHQPNNLSADPALLQQWLVGAGLAAQELQAILTDPTTDAATAARADVLLAQLESLVTQVGSLTWTAPALGSAPLPAAPTVTVAPAAAPSASAQPEPAPAGKIDVTVTPGPLHDLALASLDFKVKLGTHSVDLSQNLAPLSTLRLPSGLEIPAQAWAGPSGGHHVEGTLSFPARDAAGVPLLPPAGTLTLVIRNLGDVPERLFTLELSQVP